MPMRFQSRQYVLTVREIFTFANRGGYLESKGRIPGSHAFKAIVRLPDGER
jgi:hypothetical protein